MAAADRDCDLELRRRLAKLFELAMVDGAHPHRFRDTFAVELLLSGVPIERMSILLETKACESLR